MLERGGLVGRWFAAILRAFHWCLLSSRGIRGCAVVNENLPGATTTGPLGYFRSSFHFGVLVGGASHCEEAEEEEQEKEEEQEEEEQ